MYVIFVFKLVIEHEMGFQLGLLQIKGKYNGTPTTSEPY